MNRLFLLLAALGLLLAPVSAQFVSIRLVTYDSFSVSEGVLEAFTAETGIVVELVRLADAGATVNQVILTRDNPLGDVLYGIDNTFLSRGLKAEIFDAYESPLLSAIPDAFKIDPEFNVTPVAYGDVCLNYDVSYFEENDLNIPASLEDLTLPEYNGLLVVENPATSSPGLAFLMATIAYFAESETMTWEEYWAQLVQNDVLVVEGWTEAYYGEFSGASEDGDRPLVVSYASSPPAEVYFAEPAPETAPTAAIAADGMCFRQIEFAGILAGTTHRGEAEQLIDFLLGIAFQEDLPLQMFVFPVSPDAALPDVFSEYAVLPENPATLPADEIESNREDWIQTWTEIVLR
ncbi:MAG: thiamine ABC transporter substrate-binding protein [Chloroflexi bacterium]|nr:thiamine ABC transporter substrate-binding protein [Chloroflexota bacterium]